jgi:hypothetical protein
LEEGTYFLGVDAYDSEGALLTKPRRIDPSTTVVDRGLVGATLACDSGRSWHGIDVVFATATNAKDVQGRAIRATEIA